MKNAKKILVAVLVLLMVFSLAACGGKDEPAVKDTTLDIVLSTAPVGLHPLKTNDSPSTYVNVQMFETLYRRTVDGTAYEPLLAEALPEFSEDGLTATIKLRQGVKFHDGSDFNADAVVYMIECLNDKSYGSQRPSIVESIDSYEVVDPYTIKLNLKYVDGVLVAKLAHTNGAIVNPKLDKTQDFMVDATGAGTGAYKFVSASSGASYVLTANENYWGGASDVKDLSFTVVADEATAVARLQTGEADLYQTVLADSYNQVKSFSNVTLVNSPSSSVYYLALRSNETALNDKMASKELRQAIIEAIDMDTYIAAKLDGLATTTNSIVGPTLVGYTKEMENAGYAYNMEHAKQLIKDNGLEGTEVKFLLASRAWQQTLGAYIQAALEEIGLKVSIETQEWASFLSTAKTDDTFDFCILSWSNVTGDGQQMLEPNFSTKNGVRLKYNNAEFDEYVDKSAKTTVLSERQDWMLKAVEKIQEDAIVKTLYSANQIYAFNKNFTNVQMDCGGIIYMKEIKLA